MPDYFNECLRRQFQAGLLMLKMNHYSLPMPPVDERHTGKSQRQPASELRLSLSLAKRFVAAPKKFCFGPRFVRERISLEAIGKFGIEALRTSKPTTKIKPLTVKNKNSPTRSFADEYTRCRSHHSWKKERIERAWVRTECSTSSKGIPLLQTSMVCSGRWRCLFHSELHAILLRLPIRSVAESNFETHDASISKPDGI